MQKYLEVITLRYLKIEVYKGDHQTAWTVLPHHDGTIILCSLQQSEDRHCRYVISATIII